MNRSMYGGWICNCRKVLKEGAYYWFGGCVLLLATPPSHHVRSTRHWFTHMVARRTGSMPANLKKSDQGMPSPCQDWRTSTWHFGLLKTMWTSDRLDLG